MWESYQKSGLSHVEYSLLQNEKLDKIHLSTIDPNTDPFQFFEKLGQTTTNR